MTCREMQSLMQAYVDDELDLVHQLECERHLQDCPSCAQIAADTRALHVALRAPALRHAPPVGLEARLLAALPSINSGETPSFFTPLSDWLHRLRRPAFWLGAVATAALASVLFLTGNWLQVRTASSSDGQIAREAVAAHIRSLMVSHLADVASTNQHTVKPWFNGKLNYAPPVQDWAQAGFPLRGGRLDYLADRPVAALIYQRNLHVINVFVWPSTAQEQGTTLAAQQGYHILHWTGGGMTYWMVSDLNTGEMQTFAKLLQNGVAPKP